MLKKLPIRYQTLFFICLILLVECGVVPVISPIGFKCSDPKLSYKYKGDTIPPSILISVSLFLPLFSVVTAEWWYRRSCKISNGTKIWWRQALVWYRDFLFGFLVVITTTVIIKALVGEPRPHFLDTCRPKEADNCTDQFITKFECTNKNVSHFYIQDASKSFPSGHASFSFYLFVFLAWFFKKRLEDVRPSIVIWLQTMALTWAVLCSVSRVTDHRHHWWDILAGSFIGSLIAVCSIKSFSFGFNVKEKTSISESNSFEEKSTGSIVYLSQEDTSDTSVRWLITNVGRQAISNHNTLY